MYPAIEGANVTFSCPPGRILTGPNVATCMRNGEWEPDLQELKCLGELGYNHCTILNTCLISYIARCNPPSPPSIGQLLPYTSTLEGATVMYVCWNIHQRGRCEYNVTAVCNNQGHWEPSTEDICAESIGNI